MPDPAVVVAMREFKAGLLARENALMLEMALQWVQVERTLSAEIELLALEFAQRQIDGKSVTAAALYKMDRYKRLRAQARDETEQYAAWADGSLTQYQDGSVDLGLDQSRQAIQLAYSPGVGAFFDRLPKEAVEYMVGNAGNGRPLGELLKNRMVTQDQDVWQRLVNNLVRGTALGENPRKVARRMANDLAGGLQKALVIARTEGLRPYREASRATYEASGVVIGQKRLAAHDHRTCAACIADDGQIYPVNITLPDHPQGRCTPVPVVKGMPEVTWLAGEEWFDQQPEDVQLSILGPGKLEAYWEGMFDFKDLVKRTDNLIWGKGLVPRSLSDLLSGGRDQGAAAVDLTQLLRGVTPKAVSEFENRIRELDKEEGGLFSPSGDLVMSAQGTESQVSFTSDQMEQIRQLTRTEGRDLIFTHNHPHSNQSFSRDDVSWALRNNIAEIRAVGRDYTFVLTRPEEGWREHFDTGESWVRAQVEVETAHRRELDIEWQNHIKRFPPVPLDDPQRLDYAAWDARGERAEQDITNMYHNALQRVASQLGIDYERRKN